MVVMLSLSVCVWDKLSKMTHFMPTMTHIIVKEMARSFCDHVYKFHGLPKVILSCMDTRFKCRF